MQYGIMPMIREGQLHNMEKLISAIVKNGIPTDKMMFCTDDITANYIMENGHMDYIVRKAIGLGINPIKAIKMVTINTAEHFNLEGQFGSLTPGKAADIVLLPKLHEVKPAYVFTNGKLVAKNGILLEKIKNDYSELKKIFKPGLQNLKLEQIAISVKDQQLYTENKKVKIKVYNITNKSVEENWLNVRNGKIMNDLSKDILKMVVIDRYSEDKKHTKWAFVTGFKLKKGAIAIQVTLEEKRVAVVGTSDAEILHAVMEIDKYQGADVVVCENKVIGVLPLPIAGMMSDLSAEEVTTEMSAIYEELAKLGCNIEEPFFQVKEMFYMGYNAFQ
jgi:adenine deaminase